MTRQLQGLHTNETQRHPMQVSPPWAARELLMDSRDASLSFRNDTRDGQGLVISRLAGLGSSRGQQQRAMGPLCGEACAAWAMSRAVSVHLRIPTNATAAEVHAGAQTMQITAVGLVPTGL